MNDQLDSLLRDELREKSRRVGQNLAEMAEQLAISLERAAQAFDNLAAASSGPEARRAEYRRRECPGRFG